jgi:hypothetical protein
MDASAPKLFDQVKDAIRGKHYSISMKKSTLSAPIGPEGWRWCFPKPRSIG